MTYRDLPAINGTLNGLSAVLLSFGFYFIKKKNIKAHRISMISAFTVSVLFLTCYLIYHIGYHHVTYFTKPMWFKPIYIVILTTHIFLAIVIVPLILMTLSRALREKFDKHRKIARWTWPLWMYVSVTGVAVYLILYQIFPQTP